jgi:Tfp pilus assembly protein PilV
MSQHMTTASRAQRRSQTGATLLVAMIFLLIFAVIAGSALSGSMTSARAIGNMQWRNEAVNAANTTLDRLLSSADFARQATVVTAQYDSAPPQIDTNGDGNADITVTFPQTTIAGVAGHGPRCIRAKPVPDMSLNPDNAQDRPCFATRDPNGTGIGQVDSTGSGGGTVKTAEPNMCANTEWSITVQADDVMTNTRATVTQGVGVRVMRQVAENYCH